MAELSDEELNKIVDRVTANILRELEKHQQSDFKAGAQLPLKNAAQLDETVLWAPWTVAMPLRGDEGDGPGE